MSVRNISVKAREVLSRHCHAVAHRAEAKNIRAEHILLAILLHHPNEAAWACILLRTGFDELLLQLVAQCGMFSLKAPADTQQLPGAQDNHVVDDALWCADRRGATVCGLGDLFYAAAHSVDPKRFGDTFSDPTREEVSLAWRLAEAFGELSDERSG